MLAILIIILSARTEFRFNHLFRLVLSAAVLLLGCLTQYLCPSLTLAVPTGLLPIGGHGTIPLTRPFI